MEISNLFSLKGKTILITGASSGIGRQCAIDCSRMGAKVVLLARNESRLSETLALMSGEGHLCFSFNLNDHEHIVHLTDEIVYSAGRLDGLVNCAGISGVFPLKLMNNERMTEFFQTNVISSIALTRECVKKKHFNPDGGSVVFMSSIMGLNGESGKSLYCMTKGALISGARALACEFAKRKIRVNCISPGAVLTSINADLPYMANEDERNKLISKHLLGLGETSDISYGVIYLLSDASRWITGQNLVIDGGYTAV